MYITEMAGTEVDAIAEAGFAELEEMDLYDVCYGACSCCCVLLLGGYSC
ncbi:MAG: hypothetical protein GTN69_07000 [Armatimonadetes bacterium]|nr:hypothetical protein [Armatimonadota bacterium]